MDHIAGAPPLADYEVGQRVMTKEGYPGKVTEILEGPADVTYWVTLDHRMGGGEYDEAEIWPENGRSTAAVEQTAAMDYPELDEVLAERLPPQITTYAGAAWTHADDDDYDDDLNSPMYSPTTPEWRAADAERQRKVDERVRAEHDAQPWWKKVFSADHDEAARRIALTLPLNPEQVIEGEQAQRSPVEEQGWTEGMRDGKAGVTRNFRGNFEPEYRAGYDAGWAFGVQVSRSTPAHEVEEEKQLEDEQVVAKDPVIASSEPILIEAGALWDIIKGNEEPYKGHLSYDWCRYRRDNSCYYSKNLNVEASQQMGYAVWIPEDRGSCWRVKWTAQQACPMALPGPHVAGGFTDATVPFEEGGQRGGAPTETYRQSALEPSAPDLGFHFISSWRDVQNKAKRIRSDGGVRIVAFQEGHVVGHVRGDTNVYETELVPMPGRRSVAMWHCGCKWAAYSWGRSGPWKRYEGRMCSHALALSYEVQSRGAHGREVTLDAHQPNWLDTSIPVRTPNSYDRDKGRYSSLGQYAATLRPVYEQADDDRPIVPFVAGLLAEGVRYVDIKTFAHRLGIEDVPGLVREARRVAPFAAKVWNRIRQLFIDDDGTIRDIETKQPIAVKDVLFPGYDPVRGLAFDPRVASLTKAARPEELVNKAHTLDEAATFMLQYAHLVEPQTTSVLQGLAHRFGGEMEGLNNRFKSHGSLMRKMTAEQGHLSPPQIALNMSDALRYTMLFPFETYTAGCKSVIDALAAAGYGTRVKNYWGRGDAYNGINVALTTPAPHNFPVELQFHTDASIKMKLDVVHPIYEKWRGSHDPFERAKLGAEMRDDYDMVHRPLNVLSIENRKKQQMVPWKAVDWMHGRVIDPAYNIAASLHVTGGMAGPYRFLLTDSGQILRLHDDHSSADVWSGGGWVHSPEHGRYEFLGETTAEDISEGEAEEVIHRSRLFTGSLATQHEEPEPALPFTDGADEEDYDEEDGDVGHVASQSIASQVIATDPTEVMQDVDPVLEAPAQAGEMARGAELVARFDQWKSIVAAGGTPDFEHPFAQHGGGHVDNEVMAAAQAFASKTAVRTYTAEERQVFIKEGEDSEEIAGNIDRMDISGTHYEALQAALDKETAVSDDTDMWMLDGDPNG